jgi:hypothetical protein
MAIVTMPVLADRRMRWSPFNAPKLGFRWRTIYRFGIAEAVALALFVLVAAIAVHYHEPWDDEAQAWLIARDNSVWQIVRYRLHYEGAPPAWHLLLHAFHNVGGTYAGIGWLSMVAAAGGVYVWLRWSPFPAVLRFLVPFTFFFAYQATDRAAKRSKQNRSALVRVALREHLRKLELHAMDKRDREGYTRKPVGEEEFLWDAEAAWPED